MKKTIISIMAVAVTAFAGAAHAAEYDAAVGVRTSTLGIGIEVTTNVADGLNLRLQGNGFNYNYTDNQPDLAMDAKLKLMTVGLIADYHPFNNGFRLSAGGYYNNNKLDYSVTPTAGTFTIGATSYTAAQAGTVQSTVRFDKFAPYVGIGWGNAVSEGSAWGFNVEAGAMYQGTPTVTFTSTGGAVSAADIAAERIDMQNQAKSYKVYPVLALGVSYAF